MRNSLWHLIRSHRFATLKTRLIVFFLLLSCVPMGLSLMLLNRYYAGSLNQQITMMAEKHLRTASENCFNKSQLYFKEVFSLAIDPDFRELIVSKEGDAIERKWRIEKALTGCINSMQGDAVSMGFVTPDDDVFFTRDRLGWQIQWVGNAFMEVAEESRAAASISSRSYYNKDRLVFITACPVEDFHKKELLGYLVVAIQAAPFERILDFDSDQRYTECLITNWDGLILSHPRPEYIGRGVEEYLSQQYTPEDSVALRRLSSPDWQVVSVVKTSAINRDTSRVSLIFALVISAFIVLYVCFIVLLIGRVMRSLTGLSSAMEAVRGNGYREIPVDAPTRDIATILTGYNTMIRKLDQFNRQVERHHRNELQSMELLREAELKALEFQINPHFLYNTLHTINCQALENSDYEVSDMISCFSAMLRYIVTGTQKEATIGEEGEWLRQYLTLQQKRFDNAFRFTIDLPQDIADCSVKKLLFQPFVENAIVHGFRQEQRGQLLTLRFRRRESHLIATIADNGAGMAPDVLASVQWLFASRKEDRTIDKSSMGMGISNTWFRLQMYYGEDFDIRVSSGSQGTCFTLSLPYSVE